MKRKNGFTLIELIAVITVLAIIALIAVPKVTQIIEDSEKKTITTSASNLIRTVDMYLVKTNKKYGVVDVLDKNLNYNGENFEYGQIEINKKGNSRMYAYKEGYCITKTYNGEIEIEESTKEECSGFVDIEVLCTKTDGVDLENLTYGDKFTCELGDEEEKTFYVLENSDDTVSLIMNMNVGSDGKGTTSGSTVAWTTKNDWLSAGGVDESEKCQTMGLCAMIDKGPVTALNYLKNSTMKWTKLDSSQISLPTYDQIYKAAGNEDSDLPTWLYENLNSYDNGVAPFAYWTSTAYDNGDDFMAYYVLFGGNLTSAPFSNVGDSNFGVRPVITISKSQLG